MLDEILECLEDRQRSLERSYSRLEQAIDLASASVHAMHERLISLEAWRDSKESRSRKCREARLSFGAPFLDSACRFLQDELASGPMDKSALYIKAHAKGLTAATLRRAYRKLRLFTICRKMGSSQPVIWEWNLPSEGPPPYRVGRPTNK